MLSDILIAPSVMSLAITGLLLLCVFIIVIKNFTELKSLNLFRKILLLCLFAIAIGSHGLIHLGVEKEYNLNPYKWF